MSKSIVFWHKFIFNLKDESKSKLN